MADQQFLLDEVTDVPYDAALAPERVPLDEISRRFREEFSDVAHDPARARLAWAGTLAALDMGYAPHEAVPLAARAARAAPLPLPGDTPEARSFVIAEIRAARGQQ